MDTLLFATDGSTYADVATREAIELAAEHGATLHVCCVVDRQMFDEPALSTDELATIAVEDRLRESLKSVAAKAEEADVPAVLRHRHGIPADEILAIADEVEADAIVIGEHGDHHGHFGGVGRALEARADRPVLVVEGPDTGERGRRGGRARGGGREGQRAPRR